MHIQQPFRAAAGVKRRTFLVGVVSGVLILLAGCGGSDPEPEELQLAEVPGYIIGDWPTGTFVARSEEEWTTLWNSHRTTINPPPDQPTIDFSRYMVVGVALDGMSCDGTSFSVVSAIRTGALTTVQYKKTPAGGDYVLICKLLFDLKLIPWGSGEVQFKEVT